MHEKLHVICRFESRGSNRHCSKSSFLLVQIRVEGKQLPQASRKFYFALNKPKGYLCANVSSRESSQQKLVIDLFRTWIDRVFSAEGRKIQAVPPRLFTVGRLDVQTTGLLFVTNDGRPFLNV